MSISGPARQRVRRATAAILAALAVGGVQAGRVSAQSASGTLSGYSTGFGGGLASFQQPVNAAAFSAAAAIADGVTQTGPDQSIYNGRRVNGAGDSYSGVGSQPSSNPISNIQGGGGLDVAGGGQPTGTVLNGKVNLDAGQ